MKNQNLKIVVEFPVFSGFTVVVERASDIEIAISQYPQMAHMAKDNDDADAVTLFDGAHTCYIFLKPAADPGAIAHEAWHAVLRMLTTMGVEGDNEVVAYHLGYLVNKIHGVEPA